MEKEEKDTRSTRSTNLGRVMKVFVIMWLLTGVGLYIGQFVPIKYILPISIFTLVLLIATFFIRKSKTVNAVVVYALPTLIGVTLYSSINYYIGDMGIQIVTLVVVTTTVVFIFLGVIGSKMSKDLQGMGMYLLIGLVGLIVFSIATLFIGVSDTTMIIYSVIGLLIFIMFTVHDFNQIAKREIKDEEVSHYALGLYLDFINLILYALRLVSYLRD